MKKIITAALSFAALSATTSLSAGEFESATSENTSVASTEELKQAPVTVEGLVASYGLTEAEATEIFNLPQEEQAKKIAELEAAKKAAVVESQTPAA